ncbi:response regulator [Candidatus Peribacteria bacterium]|nr:MAG: response regulator [Candidatus Peribacteria bacterium]
MTKPLLIADDSPGKIVLLQHLLNKVHWNGPLLVAETGEEAMELMDEHPDIGFGLIDYYIPSKNGPAIIHRLKEMNPAARIALVSSSDAKKNFDEAIAAGADTCICTTYASDTVEKTILELLEEWQLY